MAEIVAARTAGRYLFASLCVVIFLQCLLTVTFVPPYADFNPDEALLVIAIREAGTEWSAWVAENHLLGQLNYYLLSRLAGDTSIPQLQFFAGLHLILSLTYALWLSRAYSLMNRRMLLIFLLLFVTSGSLYYYGQWGVFDYSQRILMSVFLLHALLFLDKTLPHVSRRSLGLLTGVSCLLIAGYAALILPVVIVAVVSGFLERRSDGYGLAPPGLRHKNAAVLAGATTAVGLITLKYFTHAHFTAPREEITWLYFPRSDASQDIAGLLLFLVGRTLTFLSTTFSAVPFSGTYDWAPPPVIPTNGLTALVVLAFCVGLVRSLSLAKTNPRRFITGLFVLLSIVSLAGLGVLGIYAYGHIRYALFLHVPMLVVAAFGMSDLAGLVWTTARRSAGWILAPVIVHWTGRALRVACGVVALVVSLAASDTVRTYKADHNEKFGTAIETIRTTDAPMLVIDTYSLVNLKSMGIEDFPTRRVFLFEAGFFNGQQEPDAVFQRYSAFMEPGEELLWVTYHERQLDDTLFARYFSHNERTHIVTDETDINMWRVIRWSPTGETSPEGTEETRSSPDAGTPPRPADLPAAPLIAAYGAVLEAHVGQDAVLDASLLPDTKPRIKSAHLTLLGALDDPAEVALLEATYLKLADFQPGVGGAPAPMSSPGPHGEPWERVVAEEREALRLELRQAGH